MLLFLFIRLCFASLCELAVGILNVAVVVKEEFIWQRSRSYSVTVARLAVDTNFSNHVKTPDDMGQMWSSLSRKQKTTICVVGMGLGLIGPDLSDELALRMSKDRGTTWKLLPDHAKLKIRAMRAKEVAQGKRPETSLAEIEARMQPKEEPEAELEPASDGFRSLSWSEEYGRRQKFAAMARNQRR